MSKYVAIAVEDDIAGSRCFLVLVYTMCGEDCELYSSRQVARPSTHILHPHLPPSEEGYRCISNLGWQPPQQLYSSHPIQAACTMICIVCYIVWPSTHTQLASQCETNTSAVSSQAHSSSSSSSSSPSCSPSSLLALADSSAMKNGGEMHGWHWL